MHSYLEYKLIQINIFHRDLTDMSANFYSLDLKTDTETCTCPCDTEPSVILFSTLNGLLFGYVDPVNITFIFVKVNNFRGDLTDVSARTKTLRAMIQLCLDWLNKV